MMYLFENNKEFKQNNLAGCYQNSDLLHQSKLYTIKNDEEFKQNNLVGWYENSDFWLQGKMRHIKDIYDFTGNEIQNILLKSQSLGRKTLVDIGCGEGWILRLLKEKGIDINYIGVDFNSKFIDTLKEKYKGIDNVEFLCMDIENPVPDWLYGYADIAVNLFNFFEIPNIDSGFANTCKMIKKNGYLLIVSIDPIMQILAISDDHKTFISNLKKYEKHSNSLGYDKDIDIGDQKSGRVYRGILYSNATYVRLAKKNNLVLDDYKEVIKTGNYIPQIYQFLYLIKL